MEKERDPFTHELHIDSEAERGKWREQIEAMNEIGLKKSRSKKRLMVKSSSQGTLLMIKRREVTPLKSVQSVRSLRPPILEVPWMLRVRRSECEAQNLLSEIRQASTPHVQEDPRLT